MKKCPDCDFGLRVNSWCSLHDGQEYMSATECSTCRGQGELGEDDNRFPLPQDCPEQALEWK